MGKQARVEPERTDPMSRYDTASLSTVLARECERASLLQYTDNPAGLLRLPQMMEAQQEQPAPKDIANSLARGEGCAASARAEVGRGNPARNPTGRISGRMAGAYVQGLGPKASAPVGFRGFPTSGLAPPLLHFRRGGTVQRNKTLLHRRDTSHLSISYLAVVAAASILTGGCGQERDDRTSGGGSGQWQVSREADQMTDVGYDMAETVLSGELFDVEVAVTCTDNGVGRYTFRVFDKDRQPEPFRETVTLGSRHYSVQVRADSQRPYNHMEFRSAYENQVQLRGGEAARAASANLLTLRFFMISGTDTVQLDQTDQAFRTVMAGCTSGAGTSSNSTVETAPTAVGDGATVRTPQGEEFTRPMRADEIEEIERSTGRRYQPGDALQPEENQSGRE